MPAKHRDKDALRIAERARKARDMRIVGMSYPQIADQLGVSVGTVRSDIKRFTEDLPKEEAIEYRDHQVALHEMMISRWAPKALKGDYKAAMVVAKYDQMRTDLLGTGKIEDDGGEQAASAAFDEFNDAILKVARSLDE